MKELLRQYLPYLAGYKRQFLLAILGMIAVAVGTAGTAQLIKPVLDDVFINKDREMLLLMPFFLVGVFALKGIGKYIQTYYTSYIGQDVVRKLRDQLVSHLTYLDMAFFRRTHSGEILSRVTNDIARIQMVVANIIPDLIRETMIIVALTGYVIFQSPKLAFYFLVIMPLAIFPLTKLANKMRKYSKLSQESTADMTTRLNEILSNIEVIKSHSSQKYEQERFAKDNQNVFRFLMKQVKTNALTSPVMETLGAVAIGIVIYIGGKEVIDGHMTVGSFFAFATALFMLYDPVKRLSSLYNKAQDAITANTRMHELLDMQPNIIAGEQELTDTIEMITFENVSLEYGDTPALKHITLQAKKGESIALVGDSGAGKSSLVNLLVRFYDPSSGEILINGTDHKAFSLTSLHRKISYVTQSIYIFNDTIAANVAYGETIDEARVTEVLEKAHAMEFINKLDEGIHTMLSESGGNLSGGQRQRIALARALYKNPDILILDEATSALDNKSEALIQQALHELKPEMITFTVAHRLSTIEDADTILVFQGGEIVCRGTHQALLETCPVYQKLSRNL
ncbi:MAG TPA: ABC transporter transmembrane domain-containing protein [Sulfurovum sp.]|uniref:ABC transporter ATP-binding protein n=1 Tax=Sulfurovum sp. TaxID=1969726 RepID=UPI002F95CB0D